MWIRIFWLSADAWMIHSYIIFRAWSPFQRKEHIFASHIPQCQCICLRLHNAHCTLLCRMFIEHENMHVCTCRISLSRDLKGFNNSIKEFPALFFLFISILFGLFLMWKWKKGMFYLGGLKIDFEFNSFPLKISFHK